MAWNRRDDDCNEHPKVLELGAWEPDMLWQKAGIWSSKHRTNGVIPAHGLAYVAHLAYLRSPAKVRKAAARLVEVGLWHDQASIAGCVRCHATVGDLPAGAYAFHDWSDCNPLREQQTDEVTKFKAERARRLKDMPALKELIRQRDRGLCRYCGDPVTSGHDTRSPKGRVFDHVDPHGDNTLDNVVTACRRCNGRKRDRTPEQAGMPLRPPPVDPETGEITAPTPPPDPGHDPGRTPAGPRPDLGPTEVETPENPGRDLGRPSRDARDGSGRAGPGSGRAPGQGPAGPGLAGVGRLGPGLAGPGLAGLVRAGSGLVDPGRAPAGPSSTSTTPATPTTTEQQEHPE